MAGSRRSSLQGALLLLLPLYVLVPRVPLRGSLGADDLLPVLVATAWWSLWLFDRRALLAAYRNAVAAFYRRPLLPGLLLFFVVAMSVSAVLGGVLVSDWQAVPRVVVRTAGRAGLYGTLGVAVFTLERAWLRRLLWLWAGVALLEALFGVGAVLARWHGPWGLGLMGDTMRAQGTFGGVAALGERFVNRSNFYAAYLLLSIPALLVAAQDFAKKDDDARHRRRLLALGTSAGVALLCAGILASQTRITVIALALASAASWVSQRRRRRSGGHTSDGRPASPRRRLVVAALFGAVVLAAVTVALILQGSHLLDVDSDRLRQWRVALYFIGEHPWLGVGDGRYLNEARALVTAAPESLQFMSDAGFVVRTPHNSILYAAASYGLATGVLYGAMLASLWWRSWRLQEPYLLFLCTAFVVHDQTNNLGFVPVVALAFVCLYAVTYRHAGVPHMR